MKNTFLKLMLVSMISFVFVFGGFATENEDYPVVDALQIQTITYQVELYREFKIAIEDAISIEEQRLGKMAQGWNTKQWHGFIDNLVDQKIILALDEAKTDKEKVPFFKKLKGATKKALKDVVASLTIMGRLDGVGTVIAYLGGTAAGYAMVGVGMMINSASMVSFFSVFPLATVTVSAVLAINSISESIKMKKAFNYGESYNYYAEYKRINKKVKKALKLKKGDLIYAFNDQNGVIIRKKGLFPMLLTLFGFNKHKVSLRFLVKALKKEKLYNQDLKDIRKSKELDYVEKIVSMIHYIENNFDQKAKETMLNRFSRQRVYNLPIVEKMKDIVVWGINTAQIDNIKDLPIFLRQAPKGVALVTIIKVYQDYVIPKVAQTIKGVKMKTFKCLREGYFKQRAMGYKNIRLQWLPESVEVNELIWDIEACVN